MSAAIAGSAVAAKAAALSKSFFIGIPHDADATSINNLASIWLLSGNAAAVISHL
jgi:hypothetical protein